MKDIEQVHFETFVSVREGKLIYEVQSIEPNVGLTNGQGFTIELAVQDMMERIGDKM